MLISGRHQLNRTKINICSLWSQLLSLCFAIYQFRAMSSKYQWHHKITVPPHPYFLYVYLIYCRKGLYLLLWPTILDSILLSTLHNEHHTRNCLSISSYCQFLYKHSSTILILAIVIVTSPQSMTSIVFISTPFRINR